MGWLYTAAAEGLKLSDDPLLVEKVYDVAGLYLNPPEAAVVFYVDEELKVQALDWSFPCPLRSSRSSSWREHQWKRPGHGGVQHNMAPRSCRARRLRTARRNWGRRRCQHLHDHARRRRPHADGLDSFSWSSLSAARLRK